jgi:hypothetical protein
MFHVERWQSDCFTWNKGGDLLKRFKLNFLHYLTKIIWWFREKVVSLHQKLRNN